MTYDIKALFNKYRLSAEEQAMLNSVQWEQRHFRFMEMYENSSYLFDDIYITFYGYRTIIVSLRGGGIFRFDNEKYTLKTEGSTLKLQEIQYPNNEIVIYENGFFYPKKGGGLMQSCQRCGRKNEYKCFTINANRNLETIIIRDHHIQALFQCGVKTIAALGDNSIYCVNHKNGDPEDNEVGNLEVITKMENTKHYHSDLKGKKNNQ